MRIRHFLATTAIVTAFATILPGQKFALAQKGVTYEPASKWSVTKVDESLSTGAAYCAMARRFNKNTILTLAKNQQQETSLALDFQAPKFSGSSPVDVVLDPGAGQQRNFTVTPVSPQAFVLKLGRDDRFFSALERTGLLRAEVGRQIYNFNLADIDTGQAKLDACVTSTIAPAAGDMSYAGAEPAANTSGIQEEIISLRRDIQNMRIENQRMKKMIETEQNADVLTPVPHSQGTKYLTAKSKTLESDNSQLRSRIESLRQTDTDISALEQENQKLKDELARNSRLHTLDLETLRKRVSLLEDENLALRADLTDSSGFNAADDLEEMRAELEQLRTENTKLQTRIEDKAGNSLLVSQLEEQIRFLQDENKGLRDDVNIAEKKAKSLESRTGLIEQLRQQIGELTALNRQKDVELLALSELTVELETLKIEKQALEQKLKTQAQDQEVIAALEQKIETLIEENGKLRTELDIARNDVLAGKTLRNDLLRLEDENASLRAMLDEQAGLELEISRLTEENISLQAALEEQQQKMQMAQTRLDAVNEANSDVMRSNENLREQVATLQSEVENTSGELKNIYQDNNRLKEEIEGHQAKLADVTRLRERLAKLQEEKQNLAETLAEHENSDGFLKADIAVLQAENIRLQSMLDRYDSKDEALASLQQRLDSLEKEKKALEANMDERENIDVFVKADMAVLKAENMRLQSMLERYSQEGEALSSLEDSLDELQQENATLKETLASQQTAVEELEPEMDMVAAMAPDALEMAVDQTPESPEPVSNAETVPEKSEPVMETAVMAVRKTPPLPMFKPAVLRTPGPVRQLAEELRQSDFEHQLAMQEKARKYINMKRKIEGRNGLYQNVSAGAEVVANIEPAAGEEAQPEDQDEKLDVVQILPEEDKVGPGAPEPSQDLLKSLEEAKSEAELYEMRMLQDIENQVSMPPPQPEEPIVVQQSADPFEGMKTEGDFDDFKDMENDMPQVPQEPDRQPSHTVPVKEAETAPVFEKEPIEKVTIQQSATLPETPVEPPQKQPVSAVPPPVAKTQQASAPAQRSGTGYYTPSFTIHEVLAESGVINGQGITLVREASDAQKLAYQWQAGPVFGSAEQRPLRAIQGFDAYVKDYLDKTEKRCSGDFAVMPDDTRQMGNVRIDSYEIACVGAGIDSSASLLFFYKNSTFTAMAHETPTENLAKAMDIRNRLAQTLGGSKG